jgi:hypothetical protein
MRTAGSVSMVALYGWLAAFVSLHIATTVDVSININTTTGTLLTTAIILRRQITSRSNTTTVHINAGSARIQLDLVVDPAAAGVEAFTLTTIPSGVRIAGGDERGVLYGVGKLLRDSTFAGAYAVGPWRGGSAPATPNGFRAMYLYVLPLPFCWSGVTSHLSPSLISLSLVRALSLSRSLLPCVCVCVCLCNHTEFPK